MRLCEPRMKLTKTQYAQIKEVLKMNHRSVDEFTFVKRKGRIRIIENVSEKVFVYFKKKSAVIDTVTQRLEARVHFLVSHSDRKEAKLSTWEEVVGSLDNWLKPLT